MFKGRATDNDNYQLLIQTLHTFQAFFKFKIICCFKKILTKHSHVKQLIHSGYKRKLDETERKRMNRATINEMAETPLEKKKVSQSDERQSRLQITRCGCIRHRVWAQRNVGAPIAHNVRKWQ